MMLITVWKTALTKRKDCPAHLESMTRKRHDRIEDMIQAKKILDEPEGA